MISGLPSHSGERQIHIKNGSNGIAKKSNFFSEARTQFHSASIPAPKSPLGRMGLDQAHNETATLYDATARTSIHHAGNKGERQTQRPALQYTAEVNGKYSPNNEGEAIPALAEVTMMPIGERTRSSSLDHETPSNNEAVTFTLSGEPTEHSYPGSSPDAAKVTISPSASIPGSGLSETTVATLLHATDHSPASTSLLSGSGRDLTSSLLTMQPSEGNLRVQSPPPTQESMLRDAILPLVLKNAQLRPNYDTLHPEKIYDDVREALTDEVCHSFAEKVRAIQQQLQAIKSEGGFTDYQPVDRSLADDTGINDTSSSSANGFISGKTLPAMTRSHSAVVPWSSYADGNSAAIPTPPVSAPLSDPPKAPRAMRLREQNGRGSTIENSLQNESLIWKSKDSEIDSEGTRGRSGWPVDTNAVETPNSSQTTNRALELSVLRTGLALDPYAIAIPMDPAFFATPPSSAKEDNKRATSPSHSRYSNRSVSRKARSPPRRHSQSPRPSSFRRRSPSPGPSSFHRRSYSRPPPISETIRRGSFSRRPISPQSHFRSPSRSPLPARRHRSPPRRSRSPPFRRHPRSPSPGPHLPPDRHYRSPPYRRHSPPRYHSPPGYRSPPSSRRRLITPPDRPYSTRYHPRSPSPRRRSPVYHPPVSIRGSGSSPDFKRKTRSPDAHPQTQNMASSLHIERNRVQTLTSSVPRSPDHVNLPKPPSTSLGPEHHDPSAPVIMPNDAPPRLPHSPPAIKSEPGPEYDLSNLHVPESPEVSNPCHSVPGLWFVKMGHEHPYVSECIFDVDRITAEKWNIPSSSINPPDLFLEHGAKISLQLLCLPTELVQAVYDSSLRSGTAEEIAGTFSGIKSEWPPQGNLLIQVNSAKSWGRTWLPRHLNPPEPPLDLTEYIREGQNVVRFIQLASLVDKVFVLLAMPILESPAGQQPADAGDKICWVVEFDPSQESQSSLNIPPATIEVMQ
ncbi:hypothetical protein Hypma_006749 [Hypsizygus marmoreus]|uniref:Uncharacterized protein n=1 Tax=Hypsizygus marmoreus TaxID=39966 RepID=A0A369JUE3_HYPMA|nr:hypothetical protein Hypma_006749 [Hypsizygus marmoreus]